MTHLCTQLATTRYMIGLPEDIARESSSEKRNPPRLTADTIAEGNLIKGNSSMSSSAERTGCREKTPCQLPQTSHAVFGILRPLKIGHFVVMRCGRACCYDLWIHFEVQGPRGRAASFEVNDRALVSACALEFECLHGYGTYWCQAHQIQQ